MRVLFSQWFWRAFRAYYSPEAIAAQIQEWATR